VVVGLNSVLAVAPRSQPWTPYDEGMIEPAPPVEEDVFGVLRGVIDPELGSNIVELGMARAVRIDPDGLVDVTIALTTSGCPSGPRSNATSGNGSADCPG